MAGGDNSNGASKAGIGCLKFLLTIFNAIFLITGLSILSLGVWFMVDLHKYLELGVDYNKASATVLICLGVAIVVVGVLACVCTCKAKYGVPLYMYCVFLVVVFIADLACGIALFVFKGKVQNEFKSKLNSTIVNDYSKKHDAIDKMQRKMECCGSVSYTDWFAAKWDQSGTNVPASCCKKGDSCKRTGLPAAPGNGTEEIYTTGCYKKVVDFVDKNIAIIGGSAIGFAFLQLLGAVLACCLGRQVSKNTYEHM